MIITFFSSIDEPFEVFHNIQKTEVLVGNCSVKFLLIKMFLFAEHGQVLHAQVVILAGLILVA